MQSQKYFATVLLLYTFFECSIAWGMEGHLLIAQIAYTQLKPQTQSATTEMAKAFGSLIPSDASDFLTASLWADDIRSFFTAFNAWHYIDIPYNPTNLTNVPTVQPENVLWALGQAQYTLRSKRSETLWGKATMLRLLIHFVADVHQPLHSITYCNSQFPNGDLGGNSFIINVDGRQSNLHSFWDNGGGLYSAKYDRPLSEEDTQALISTANNIMTSHPPSYFGETMISNTNFSQWTQESYDLAVTYAYLNGQLKYEETVSSSYIADAQNISTLRIALGGYRLAYLLNSLVNDTESITNVCNPTVIDYGLFGGVVVAAVVVGIMIGVVVTSVIFVKKQKRNNMDKEPLLKIKS